MSSIHIPKRKKDIGSTSVKHGQSQKLVNRSQNKKSTKKPILSLMSTKSTLINSRSVTRLKKSTVSLKTKNTKALKKLCEPDKQKKKHKQTKDNNRKQNKKFHKQITAKQCQLTQRKKIHLQYFMYKDTYLPIENTEQRKIIYRIQLIDEKILFRSESLSKKNKKMVEISTEVEKKQCIDVASQRTDRNQLSQTNISCQTEPQQQKTPIENPPTFQLSKFELQKPLIETLSQLQFLYLPDDKNFQGFSRMEKAHYKQLLLFMAKKFQDKSTENECYDEETIQLLIQQRQLKQKGTLESFAHCGFPTHAPAILSYISNLFCYLEIHEKNQIVDRINCTYGYSLFEKLHRVKTGRSLMRGTPILGESIFWQFQTQLHYGLPITDPHFEQALHAHNRAIFDTTNEILQQFQPYYASQGEPFPWSRFYETTFFCITENNFDALCFQVSDRISQYINTLGGILLESSTEQKFKIHIQKILENQQKIINDEIKRYNAKLKQEAVLTGLLCQIAELIGNQIINEGFLC